MEFPAVCVVTTSATLTGILSFLETGAETNSAEEARKLYVGASRAERLLAFAVPKNHALRVATLLQSSGTEIDVLDAV